MFFTDLKAYQPFDHRDAASLDKIKNFVQGFVQCENMQKEESTQKENIKENIFSRTHLVGHITASAWVVNTTCDKALLLEHKKLCKWLQPGGHADGSADTLSVARRELWEETGLQDVTLGLAGFFDVDVHHIPAGLKGRVAEPAHIHYDVRYLFIADEGLPLILSEESNAIAWVAFKDIMAYNPELQRLVEKTNAQKHKFKVCLS